MRDARQPDGVPMPKPPYSPVVVAGDLVFTAGQVAFDASGQLVDGGIVEQTRQAMQNLAACLDAAGCSMDDIVKTTVFLTDLATNFEACNEEYARHLNAPVPRPIDRRGGARVGAARRDRGRGSTARAVRRLEHRADGVDHPVVVIEHEEHASAIERGARVRDAERDGLAGAQLERRGQLADRVLIHQARHPHRIERAPIVTDAQWDGRLDVGGHVALPEADHRDVWLRARQDAPPRLDRRAGTADRAPRRTASRARTCRGRA